MKFSFLILMLLLSRIGASQNGFPLKTTIFIEPVYEGIPVNLHDTLFADEGYIILSELKFYLGQFKFFMNGEEVFYEPHYQLFDLAEGDLYWRKDFNTPVNRVEFMLGVDSVTSTSGAFEWDLDPLLGMYWSWQSGYINLKVEGESSFARNKENEFIYHLGGYERDQKSQRMMSFELDPKTNQYTIRIELKSLLNAAQIQQKARLMTPGPESAQLMNEFAKGFSIESKK